LRNSKAISTPLFSCGFDASEYEDPDISRHNRKVPTSFFYEFTKDAVAFAERYANGRIISILEGGYSDRALISGAMAHLCGLVDMGEDSDEVVDSRWWSRGNLVKVS
jgi:histone deacetylase HOS3